jgi:DNA-binding beta-propeller fold protein YncE
MLQRIQLLSRPQRIFIFALIFIGGIALIVAITLILISFTVNNQPRALAQSLVEGVTVREFAQFPDDDAYPAIISVAPNGMLYTGSYATGTVFEISQDGTVLEIPQTRDFIGSVAGITVGADGMLYVFDRLVDNPRSAGGVIWRFFAGDTPQEWGVINDERGFVSPEDILALPTGEIIVADRGRREIWRFDVDGNGSLFWANSGTLDLHPTGLTYDSLNNAILVTDSGENRIYRLPLDGSGGQLIYSHPVNDATPDFTGIALGDDGTIYIAALGGGVLSIPATGGDTFTTLAINFRGARDVAYYDGRLFVTNFDSASLVSPFMSPQLPFAIDVIEFESTN